MRLRGIDLFAILLAALGTTLAIQAWLAGSLFRYVLAGLVLGGVLWLPLLSIVLLRERARRFWRRLLWALLPLALLLGAVELAMRWLGPATPPHEVIAVDNRLGHTIVPGTGGTDAWGFRNASVPDHTDALFVGDSQTWGFFLDRDQAFPALFAARTGLTSYQMANGSYGPVRYRELTRRGLALKPSLVVIGFYFGNDLFDAEVGAGLDGAEDLRAEGVAYHKLLNPKDVAAKSPNWTMALADFVQEESRLCGWSCEVVKSQLRGAAGLLDQQAGAVPFREGAVSTVLLPDYRQPVLDLAKPDMRDGLRITKQCLHDIAKDARAAAARCLLLAIPTKEYCYAEWLRQRGTPLAELQALHAAETTVRGEVFAAAQAAGLELIDLAPICITALAADTPIWAGNGDGHLMKNGHLAAARAIEEAWSRK